MASMFVEQSANPQDHESQDKFIWRMLLPKIPWERKREVITQNARAQVSKGLEQFLAQWLAWTRQIENCSRWRPLGTEEEGTEIASNEQRKQTVQTFPIVLGTSKSKAECEAANPFMPHLTF